MGGGSLSHAQRALVAFAFQHPLHEMSACRPCDEFSNAILTLDRNSYGHLQVLIPINLEDNHWVLARVDFRCKHISIYDSMKEFRENKTYGQLLKPLQVIFPQWLEDVGFYDI